MGRSREGERESGRKRGRDRRESEREKERERDYNQYLTIPTNRLVGTNFIRPIVYIYENAHFYARVYAS